MYVCTGRKVPVDIQYHFGRYLVQTTVHLLFVIFVFYSWNMGVIQVTGGKFY